MRRPIYFLKIIVRRTKFSGNFVPPDQNFRRTKISVTVQLLTCGLVGIHGGNSLSKLNYHYSVLEGGSQDVCLLQTQLLSMV